MVKEFMPSLLMSEIYFPIINEKDVTSHIIENSLQHSFYQSIEIAAGQDKNERKRILNLKEENNLLLTQWLTFVVEKNGYDIASSDEQWRRESINKIKEYLYLGAESGAENIAFVPGNDPGMKLRGEFIERFYEGVCEICEEATHLNLNILIEPLDRGVDKNRLIGPTNEANDLIKRVKKDYKNVGLAFDTAHSALNGENVVKAVKASTQELYQVHFSNAVLDKSHHLFGDLHMPIGDPGFLNVKGIASILKELQQTAKEEGKKIPIAIEARSQKNDDLEAKEKLNREILESAIKMIEEL